jgi:hypothetical protein
MDAAQTPHCPSSTFDKTLVLRASCKLRFRTPALGGVRNDTPLGTASGRRRGLQGRDCERSYTPSRVRLAGRLLETEAQQAGRYGALTYSKQERPPLHPPASGWKPPFRRAGCPYPARKTGGHMGPPLPPEPFSSTSVGLWPSLIFPAGDSTVCRSAAVE